MRFAPLPLAAALGAVLLGGCTNPGAPLPTDFAPGNRSRRSRRYGSGKRWPRALPSG